MYKVTGKENDMFKVLDLDEGTEELLSAEQLVLALGVAELDGCKHSQNGIEVWYDGVEKYEIPIEVWAPVSVFNMRRRDGSYKYVVSNLGHAKIQEYYDSVGRFHKERNIGSRTTDGYISIHAQVNCVSKILSVHSLVASEFIYNPNGLPQVNHKNENKLDNRAFNLEWCTAEYNVNYGTANIRRSKTLGIPVRQYSIDGKLIGEFYSASSGARATGANSHSSHSSVIASCLKTGVVAFGFVWRYVSDDELFNKTESERKVIISALIGGKYAVLRNTLRQYTPTGLFIQEFPSRRRAEEKTGASVSDVGKVCRRARKTCSGFIWRYAHDDEFADRPENAKAIEEWRKRESGE